MRGRCPRCGSGKPSVLVPLLLVLLFNAPWVCAQDNSPSEYQLKAAFLFSFAKFVDWPPDSFASPQAPFSICILGADPFGQVIDDVLRDKTIGDHPVVVKRTNEPAEVRHCQIVFISSSESRRLPEILSSLQGASVLIVGDTDHFADSGGTIGLMLEQNHIRFAINTVAAESAGLKISSKLLALAKIVRGPAERVRN
jgi:hypothetical protein